ncbi:MAG: hypothetical protein GX312_00855 [Candidatus Phytoplasma sp.]|nr:hypothetical protein [Phytoplasma sp.]
MRKIHSILVTIIGLVFLVGCLGDTSKKGAEKFLEEISFTYVGTDNKDNVTSNFTISSYQTDKFDITWESLSDYLKVLEQEVIVTRPTETQEAKLKVIASENEKELVSKEFSFTIIKRDENKVFVTINYNFEGKANEVKEITKGDVISEPAVTREGYTLDGWFNGLRKFDFSAPIQSDITLKAIWSKVGTEEPGDESLSIKYDFTTLERISTTALPNEQVFSIFSNDQLVSVEADKVYEGNETGGSYENQAGFIKMGSSSVNGSLTLNYQTGTKVSKVVIYAEKWSEAKTDTMTINGQSITLTSVVGASHVVELTTPTNVVEIQTQGRAFIFKMELEGLGGGGGSTAEELDVTFDFESSQVVKKVIKGQKVTQPTIPSNPGYKFVGWTYNNEPVDLLTTPIYESVTLKAKWEKDGEVENPGIELPEITKTIASIINSAAGTSVEVEAVVTGIIGTKYIIISDKDGEQATYLYYGKQDSFPSSVVVGDYINVKGTMGAYEGLIQIVTPTVTQIGGGYKIPTPFKLEIPNIKEKDQGKRVTLEGLKLEVLPSDMSKNFTLYLKLGTQEIQVRIENDFSTWAQKIRLAGVGGELNLNGIHVGWHKGLQFMPINPSVMEITKANGTDEPEVPGPTEPEGPIEIPSGDYNVDFNGYYRSLTNLTDQKFSNELRSIIKTTGSTSEGKTDQVKEVDKYNGKNYNIYDGYGPYGNREHVWPKSHLGNNPKFDLHNLRAAEVDTNSKRGNDPFGEGSGEWKSSGGKFYPGDEHVGDVARIVLYIHVKYNLSLAPVGNLSMFLKWHEQDPVNDFERSRNGKIESIKGSRNPFIDYPVFVDYLFGTVARGTMFEEVLYEVSILLTENYYHNEKREYFLA